MTQEITGSVGEGGINQPSDVRVVQRLLIERRYKIGSADGICGQRTKFAIITFQHGFMKDPDGRIDPHGVTWNHLTGAPDQHVDPTAPLALTALMPRPHRDAVNVKLTAVSNAFMLSVLGNPRESYSEECQAVTNPRLKRNMVIESVGPFRVQGLIPAVASLRMVLRDVNEQRPDVYKALGTAGMLCCRYQRGSRTNVSNHSWGTAVDLKIQGVLDRRGDNRVQRGLALIAPIFNNHGWYWGATFNTEDAMHFEASRSLIASWTRQVA